MITVVCTHRDRSTAREFFELFKVPWNFHGQGETGQVLLVNGAAAVPDGGRLVILFDAGENDFDLKNGIGIKSHYRGVQQTVTDDYPPLYCGWANVLMPASGLAGAPSKTSRIGVGTFSGRTIIRVGWDLFEEVRFLLEEGQPVKHAHRPTLEEHIDLIRCWIVTAGIGLVEVPPRPHEYPFTVCLTHDVDFLGIRHHLFDRTIIGFVMRALLPFLFGHAGGRISFSDYMKNLSALLQLPLIAMGLKEDFLNKLKRYSELEEGLGSTFFMIPYKDEPGGSMPVGIPDPSPPGWRAARYDVKDYSWELRQLKRKGHEIGLHGLDAWIDAEKGNRELKTIQAVAGKGKVGVRMHWLFFDRRSHRILESAGFDYDSTVGYNDTIGFKSGTSQAYRMPDVEKILELPLVVQDTAMFFRKRMALKGEAAAEKCRQLIHRIKESGGVFTVNWHQRSIAPERNWERFYQRLLHEFKSHGAWFATCSEAANWYRMRRQITFGNLELKDGSRAIRVEHTPEKGLPAPVLRRYRPGPGSASNIQGRTALDFEDEGLSGSVVVHPLGGESSEASTGDIL